MSAFRNSIPELATAAVALVALIGGCTANTEGQGYGPAGYGPSLAGGGGPEGSDGGASGGGVQLVDIDPNQTLTAQPGQGVGVFTEYATGGHWHIWWTCDTSVTNLSCNFEVTASAASGTISNLVGELSSPSDQVAQTSPSEVSATTVTTTAVDGVRFDTTPADIITLDAKLDGNESGAFLFFVQGGKVNGGYQGTLDDPLMLEPSSP